TPEKLRRLKELLPSVTNPWIKHRIDEVNRKGGEANKERVRCEDANHNVVVPTQDAGYQLLTESRDAEYVLDHHRARDDAGDEWAQDADHRYQGVAQRVAKDHDSRLQPLSPCRADIVLADHLQHAGARKSGDDGRVRQAQCQRRDGDLLDLAPADVFIDKTTRPRIEAGDGEQYQQKRPDETGHAVADHGRGRGDIVDPGVLPDRRDGSECQADANRDQDRGQPERHAHPGLPQQKGGAHTADPPSAAGWKDGLVLQKLDALPAVVVQPVVARAPDVGLDQVGLGAVVDGHPDDVVDEHLLRLDVVRHGLLDRLRV